MPLILSHDDLPAIPEAPKPLNDDPRLQQAKANLSRAQAAGDVNATALFTSLVEHLIAEQAKSEAAPNRKSFAFGPHTDPRGDPSQNHGELRVKENPPPPIPETASEPDKGSGQTVDKLNITRQPRELSPWELAGRGYGGHPRGS
jgi:hypothetical protein